MIRQQVMGLDLQTSLWRKIKKRTNWKFSFAKLDPKAKISFLKKQIFKSIVS